MSKVVTVVVPRWARVCSGAGVRSAAARSSGSALRPNSAGFDPRSTSLRRHRRSVSEQVIECSAAVAMLTSCVKSRDPGRHAT